MKTQARRIRFSWEAKRRDEQWPARSTITRTVPGGVVC